MRYIHFSSLSAFVALLLAFGVQTASAQTPILPRATLQQLGASGLPAGYCKQFTLTGPIFLNMMDTIVKHGDLTDIAFLEKTLGTHLSLNPWIGPYGTPDPDTLYYKSDQVLGSSVPVEVRVFKGKKIQAAGGLIAEVRFQPPREALFPACLTLTSADFVSLFGRLSFMWIGGPLSHGDGYIRLKTPGKNGTKLEFSFAWVFNYEPGEPLHPIPQDESVVAVTISQYK